MSEPDDYDVLTVEETLEDLYPVLERAPKRLPLPPLPARYSASLLPALVIGVLGMVGAPLAMSLLSHGRRTSGLGVLVGVFAGIGGFCVLIWAATRAWRDRSVPALPADGPRELCETFFKAIAKQRYDVAWACVSPLAVTRVERPGFEVMEVEPEPLTMDGADALEAYWQPLFGTVRGLMKYDRWSVEPEVYGTPSDAEGITRIVVVTAFKRTDQQGNQWTAFRWKGELLAHELEGRWLLLWAGLPLGGIPLRA
ncbi:MAG: hypothetical protein AB7N76_36285 [Planctomycetota bacterium]